MGSFVFSKWLSQFSGKFGSEVYFPNQRRSTAKQCMLLRESKWDNQYTTLLVLVQVITYRFCSAPSIEARFSFVYVVTYCTEEWMVSQDVDFAGSPDYLSRRGDFIFDPSLQRLASVYGIKYCEKQLVVWHLVFIVETFYRLNRGVVF